MLSQTTNNSNHNDIFYHERSNYEASEELSPNTSGMSTAPKRHDGIKVTTGILPQTYFPEGLQDDNHYETEASCIFQNRCAKFQTVHSKKAFLQPNLQKSKSCPETLLLHRISNVQKVRIIKTVPLKESPGLEKGLIRYKLEDFDEILDSQTNDDDSMDLQSLRFGVALDASSLNVSVDNVRRSRVGTEGEANIESMIQDGFELGKISTLRDKMFGVNLMKDDGGSNLLGKIEFKRYKHRIYDINDKLMYKVHRTKLTNPREQEIAIVDHNKENFCKCVLKHLNPQKLNCEIEFPEKCTPDKKVLIVSAVMAMMERIKPFTGKFSDESVVEKPSLLRRLITLDLIGCSK